MTTQHQPDAVLYRVPDALSTSYVSLLDHAFDGILILSATGACLEVNSRLCQMLGYTRGEVLACGYADLLDARENQDRPPRFDELQIAGRLVTERRFRRKDGSILVGEAGTTLLEDGRILAVIRDVSERRAAEEARRASEELFRHAFEYSGAGMALAALDGRLMRVNSALCEMLGYSEADLLTLDLQALSYPDDLAPDLNNMMRLVAGSVASYRMDKRYLHQSGAVVWAQLSVSLIRDAAERPLHFVAHVVDVSALKQAESRLQTLSTVDDLTGILNRRGFLAQATRELQVAKRARTPMLLLYLDLDRFKVLNDSCGHAEGDVALAAVGQVLRDTLRETDVLGRIGGDEFVVLAMNRTAETMSAITTRLSQRLQRVNAEHQWPQPLSFSIGAAEFMPHAPTTLEELMHVADMALYEQKRARREDAADADVARTES